MVVAKQKTESGRFKAGDVRAEIRYDVTYVSGKWNVNVVSTQDSGTRWDGY